MKKLLAFAAIIGIILTASYSCKKSAVPNPPPPPQDSLVALYVGGTLNKMIIIDESATTRRFLEMPDGGGPVYRHQINKSYDFSYIASTFYAKWKIENATTVVFPPGTGPGSLNDEIVMIHSSKFPENWLWVVKGGTVNGKEEWYVWSHYISSGRPNTDQYKFRLHQVSDQNGAHAYTIESVQKPGSYLSNAGHTITANGVLLEEFITNGKPKTIFEIR